MHASLSSSDPLSCLYSWSRSTAVVDSSWFRLQSAPLCAPPLYPRLGRVFPSYVMHPRPLPRRGDKNKPAQSWAKLLRRVAGGTATRSGRYSESIGRLCVGLAQTWCFYLGKLSPWQSAGCRSWHQVSGATALQHGLSLLVARTWPGGKHRVHCAPMQVISYCSSFTWFALNWVWLCGGAVLTLPRCHPHPPPDALLLALVAKLPRSDLTLIFACASPT
jgi:hypothetical protein